VIHDAHAGLTCAAGDSAALAKKVLELAAMPAEKRQHLGKNGQSYSVKEFGRSQLMDRMEALLSEAMGMSQVKAPKALAP